jgi:hypothetical protein
MDLNYLSRITDAIEEIRKAGLSLKPKQSISIVLSSNTTDFTTKFIPQIYLDKDEKYEMALVRLETYYSFPNIDNTNNVFKYSPNKGNNWYTIVIPEGTYEINQVNDEIHRLMKLNNHWDSTSNEGYISIEPNFATLKAKIRITHSDYIVDFNVTNSIRSTLGYDAVQIGEGYHEGDKPVNILSINSILVNCSIIGGSYVGGSKQPTIYSFFPDVEPGMKIIEKPTSLVYLPVFTDIISNIRIWLTDQNGRILNLRGENVTIRFEIRQV